MIGHLPGHLLETPKIFRIQWTAMSIDSSIVPFRAPTLSPVNLERHIFSKKVDTLSLSLSLSLLKSSHLLKLFEQTAGFSRQKPLLSIGNHQWQPIGQERMTIAVFSGLLTGRQLESS